MGIRGLFDYSLKVSLVNFHDKKIIQQKFNTSISILAVSLLCVFYDKQVSFIEFVV
jgi:hypothetical protein